MTFILVSFCFVFFVLNSHANCDERVVWVAGESGLHPDHPGKCWPQTLNREFNVGDEFTDKTKCQLIRCGASLRFSRRV